MSNSFSKGLKNYTIGFVLSVVLTLLAYGFVVGEYAAGFVALSVLTLLAMTQLVVQLIYFLHLGEEEKPYLKSSTFLYMTLVVSIVFFFSVWIMVSLHRYHRPPDDVYEYLLEAEGRSNHQKNDDANDNHQYHTDQMMEDHSH